MVQGVRRLTQAQRRETQGCWRDNIFIERLWRSLEYEGGLSARQTFFLLQVSYGKTLGGSAEWHCSKARSTSSSSRPCPGGRCTASRSRVGWRPGPAGGST